MKLWFAGNSGVHDREHMWYDRLSRRLLSYWYIKNKQFIAHYAFDIIKEGKRTDTNGIKRG